MSAAKPNATPAIIKNEIQISNRQRDNSNSKTQHQILSNDSDSVEFDDALSVAYTSCSDYSNDICHLDSNEPNLRPNFIENIEPSSNANIGSVCVENSTNVTFGNKTYFNGPVVIKHFVVDGNVVEGSDSKTLEGRDNLSPLKISKAYGCYLSRKLNDNLLVAGTEQTFNGKRERKCVFGFRDKSSLVFLIAGSVVVIVITLIVVGYYVFVLGKYLYILFFS